MCLRLWILVPLAAAALSSLACRGTEEEVSSSGGTGNATAHNDDAGSQNVGGLGGATSDEEIALPLVVDFNFFPSGAFGRLLDTGVDGVEDDFADGCGGDDEGEWDNIAIDQTDAACPERPSEVSDDALLGLARCNSFSFTPASLDAVDQTTWAGVLFENTICNWGSEPGSPIVSGASTLSFWAWSDSANVGTQIVFQAGGVGNGRTPYRDSFTRTLSVNLTETPTRYEIDLGTATYPMGVISAFGWTAERTTVDPLMFYVDGMLWE